MLRMGYRSPLREVWLGSAPQQGGSMRVRLVVAAAAAMAFLSAAGDGILAAPNGFPRSDTSFGKNGNAKASLVPGLVDEIIEDVAEDKQRRILAAFYTTRRLVSEPRRFFLA